jgi:hypothetical protein
MMHMIWLLTFTIKFDLVVSAVLRSCGRTDLGLNKFLRHIYYLLKVFLFVPSTEPASRHRERCNLERGFWVPS